MLSRMLPCVGICMGTFLFMAYYLDPHSPNSTEARLAMRINNALHKVAMGQVDKALNYSFCCRLAGSCALLAAHFFASEAMRRAAHWSGLASKIGAVECK